MKFQASFKKENINLQKEINLLKQGYDALHEEVDQVKENLNNSNEENNLLMEANHVLRETVNQVKESSCEEINLLKKENDSLKRKIDGIKDNNFSLMEEIESLSTNFSIIVSQVLQNTNCKNLEDFVTNKKLVSDSRKLEIQDDCSLVYRCKRKSSLNNLQDLYDEIKFITNVLKNNTEIAKCLYKFPYHWYQLDNNVFVLHVPIDDDDEKIKDFRCKYSFRFTVVSVNNEIIVKNHDQSKPIRNIKITVGKKSVCVEPYERVSTKNFDLFCNNFLCVAITD